MKDFLTKNFTVLLIAALFIFLYAKGSFSSLLAKGHTDTLVQIHYIPGQGVKETYIPPVNSTVPVVIIPPAYSPDTSYKGLLRQYQQMLSTLLAKNAVHDTLSLKDSSGRAFAQINLEDTVSGNRISSRKWNYHYSLPHTTITIKEPYQPRIQLYYGMSVSSPLYPALGIQQFSVGLLLKNKKDQILGASLGYSFPTHSPALTLHYYQKLSFK